MCVCGRAGQGRAGGQQARRAAAGTRSPSHVLTHTTHHHMHAPARPPPSCPTLGTRFLDIHAFSHTAVSYYEPIELESLDMATGLCWHRRE